MKQVSLSGSPRENVGKRSAKDARNAGLIPCVVYGGEEQVHFTLDSKAFDKLIFTPDTYLVNLKVGDKEFKAILQDVQYHPVKDIVLHADFLQVIDGKEVKLTLPVTLSGVAPGVVRGGKLRQKIRKIKVKGLVENLPDNLHLTIDGLDIGNSIKVKDVEMENVSFLDPQSAVIVGVKMARGATAAEEEGEEGGEE